MEPTTTAALISGGLKLVGGLFGRKKRPKAKTLTDLRNEAQAAGFNPLTALQATGGNGFNNQPQGPVLSTAEVLANGLGDLAETWFNQDKVERDEQMERIKLETMQAELENVNARTDALKDRPFGSSIPTYEASDTAPAQAVPLESKPGTATDPRDIGEGSWLNPRLADAESAEARYGDIAQEMKGGANLINDTIYDSRLRSLEKKHGREVAEKVHNRYRAETGKSLTSIIKEETAKFDVPLNSKPLRQKAEPGWMNEKLGAGHW